MGMHVEYREYEERDRAQVEEMIFGLYREDPTDQDVDREKIAATLAECALCPDKLRLLTIHKDGEIVGYAIVLFFWSNQHGGDTLHLDELYIKEAFRNQGIGTRFMEDLPALFPKAYAISLEVTPINHRAMRLYKRLGFIESPDTFLRRLLK